jgi:tetratricopeptide (TPR) repeat protein
VSPSDTGDVHAPYVQALADAGDWAGLVRYWMAHRHEAALDRAILVAERLAARDGHPWRRLLNWAIYGLAARQRRLWIMLTDFLAEVRLDPFDLEREPSEEMLAAWSGADHATLILLVLYPRVALCERAAGAVLAVQDQMLYLGLEAGEQAYELTEMVGDAAAGAFFRSALARGYRELSKWDKAQACYEEAVSCYRGLAARRPEVYQPDLAGTLNNLGTVLDNLWDLDGARACLEEALAIFRRLAEQRPDLYQPALAMTLLNLGNVQRVSGNPDDAQAHLDAALAIKRRLAEQRPEVYQPDLAGTLYNLGTVQLDSGDLDGARACLEEALAIFRPLAEQHPNVHQPNLAMVLTTLGIVQVELGELEGARAHVAEALAIRRYLAELRPEVYQLDLAKTFHVLGNVKAALGDPDGAQACYEEALASYRRLAAERPEVHRSDLAKGLSSLGDIRRHSGDPDGARAHFEEALAIQRHLAKQRPEVYQSDLAMTLNNLGTVVAAEFGDLHGARAHFEEALAIQRRLAEQRPEVYQPSLANTLHNLSNIQRDSGDPDGARAHLEAALVIRRRLAEQHPEVHRRHVATVLGSLGTVLQHLGDRDAARVHHEEALAIFRRLAEQRPEVHRPALAATLHNLGTVQLDLGDVDGARARFEEVTTLYSEVAAAWPTAHLSERQTCWAILGSLYRQPAATLGWPDYYKAREALRQARTCAELSRGRFRDPGQRRRVQGLALPVYDLLVQSCVDIWHVSGAAEALQEAIEVAEASRARNLMELLADEALQPTNAPPGLVQQFRSLRRRLRQAERRLQYEEGRPGGGRLARDPTAPTEAETRRIANARNLEAVSSPQPEALSAPSLDSLRQQIAPLEREYRELLARIRADYDPEFNPEQPVPPVTFQAARELLPADRSSTIVQYALTQDNGLALVVTGADILPVPLPGLSDRQAWELAGAWYVGYRYFAIRNAKNDPHGLEHGEEFLAKQVTGYEATFGLASAQALRDLCASVATWDEALPVLLEPVAERAVRPVVAALAGRDIGRLILSPNRALHLFPLHACRLADGRYLADACEVVYTPSLSILSRCAARRRRERRRLLLVENPTCDLPFTEVEGAALRRLYPEHKALFGGHATKEHLQRVAAACHVLNYSGHAVFNMQDPMGSALVLGDTVDPGQWLTLRDIFCSRCICRRTS